MTGQDLKNSILQLAIQGKLVPQNPHDEPASKLLKSIKDEKERLVAEKKIKKEKPLAPISDDEKPFEIPDSWEWCRFGTVTINRDCERIPLSVGERSALKKVYDYYGASGVIDKVDNFLFDKPLLLIGEDGANLINRSTPIAFIARGQYWVNNHAHVLDYINEDFMKYICLHINAISLVDYVTGTAQPKMNQEKMNSIPLAIPPLKEQQRIVAKIEELMPLVEEYDKAQRELDDINSKLPEQLKQSILQEAIMGKLGTNNPDDEPASELLKSIRKEKAQLIKDKKIKKEKPLPEITDEEKPFDIPENWVWCRVADLSYTIFAGGDKPKDFQTSKDNKHNIPVVANGISNEGILGYTATATATANTITVAGRGTIGFTLLRNYDYCPIVRLIVIEQALELDAKFLVYALQTIKVESLGTSIPQLTVPMLKPYFLPLPPLAEQHRIVEKLDALLPQISELNKQ